MADKKNLTPRIACTMSGNKLTAKHLASQSGFENQHPLVNPVLGVGMLSSVYELQQAIENDTGCASVSFSCTQFETGIFSTIAMIKAWHLQYSEATKTEFIFIGDVAQIETVTGQIEFDLKSPPRAVTSVDRPWARLNCGDKTAAVFLFPPQDVEFTAADVAWIVDRVHYCGGLIVADSSVCRLLKRSNFKSEDLIDLYLLDLCRLFDLPGSGPQTECCALAASEQLAPFLPVPRLISNDSLVRWSEDHEYPDSIGRTSVFGASRFDLLSLAIELQLGSTGLQVDKA